MWSTDVTFVLHAFVDEFDVDAIGECIRRQYLAALQGRLEVLEGVEDGLISNMQRSTDNGQQRVGFLGLETLRYHGVKPRCTDVIALEVFCLQQRNEILYRCSEVTAN